MKKWIIVGVFLLLVLLVLQSGGKQTHRGEVLAFTSTKTAHELKLRGEGAVQEGMFDWGGLKRTYLLYTPPSLVGQPAHTDASLVVYLHGGGRNMLKADWIFPYADAHGFYVLAPEGSSPTILTWLNMYTWNAGTTRGGGLETGCCGYSFKEKIDDVGFIGALTRAVASTYTFTPSHTYLVGASNGAAMAYRTACEDGDLFASVVALASPGVPLECAGKVIKPSVMHVHGTKDLCVPYEPIQGISCNREAFKSFGISTEPEVLAQQGARSIYETLRTLTGLDTCPGVRDTTSTEPHVVLEKTSCAGDASLPVVALMTVDNMGHVLPSDVQYAPAEFIGPLSTAVSFEDIWSFLIDPRGYVLSGEGPE